MEKKKETWEPIPLYLPLDVPKEKEETKEKTKEKRGIIEMDISENSLEILEV